MSVEEKCYETKDDENKQRDKKHDDAVPKFALGLSRGMRSRKRRERRRLYDCPVARGPI